MPSPDDRSLHGRIWNAFPVTQPAFAKLLSLLDIEITQAVPTAAVTLGRRSRLQINPDFAAEHCATDQGLVMLVLHELFHVVLGHTRLIERCTPSLNFAFDAVINAQLCLLHPGPEWTRLFRESYGAQEAPWCLLRPPEGWGGPAPRWLPGTLGALHRRLYTDESASYLDLLRLLDQELAGDLAELAGPAGLGRLLGNHGEETGIAADPTVAAEIREIIARWPMVIRRSGRDLGGPETAFRLALAERRQRATATLRRALLALGDAQDEGAGRPRFAQVQGATLTPLPTGADRRAQVLRTCGAEPLLYRGETLRPALRRGARVHVYLDVSGSMDGVVGPLYRALGQLTEWMVPRIHLFSTTVKDISPAELRRGQGASTQGTAISVVTAHLVEHDVRRALIVTDGWVGQVPPEHALALARRKGRWAVALTAGGDPGFAATLGARVWHLPDFAKEQA